MDTLIRFENVTYRYRAEDEGDLFPPALDDVSLTINRGSFVSVLGHNGCGKSTLAKLCNAVLIPTQGRVLVGGTDTADESELLAVRQSVGMVFQNPDNQIVATVVEEDVAFALENLGVPPKEIRRRVDKALETVGMTDYRLHAPHRLSGGQKQRIAIAGIIAMEPACIVMDEPTAMLDPHGRQEVLDTITRLNRELGITILLITHHMNEAAHSDRILVMNRGRILLDGTPRQIFGEYDILKRHGLTVPQTVELSHQAQLPPALDVEECAQALCSWIKNRQAG